MKFSIYSILFLLFIAGCSSKEINSEQEYESWLNNPENGHAVTKSAGSLKFTVKYIPPEYLIYKEKKKMKYQPTDKELKDLKNRFASGMTFMMTIAPADPEKESRDIMYYNITGEAELDKRIKLLNFEMDKFVKIKAGTVEFIPVLHLMENTHGTTNYRHLHFVFVDNKENNMADADELDFTFNDEIFGTGISHFIFNKKQLKDSPVVKF